ncbi:MAG: hypothetical protein AAF950_04305 [Pseudomonadota bacterium]
MKNTSQIPTSDIVMPNVAERAPFVNEITDVVASIEVAKSRPHILRRREARWARRIDR